MAARRLLIVMLLLLGISTLAAALVPPPERETQTDSSTSTTRSTPTRERPEGERVAAEVTARSGGPPEIVRVSTGDQLALVVKVARAAEVEVPAFGLVEFAEPGAPARFDVLVDEPGRFEVNAERKGTVATIVAQRPRRQS